jgi:hypothetical protein
MNAAVTVPVSVTPEAAERLAEVGCQEQYEQMLGKICELIPDLRWIKVWLVPAYEEGDEPGIILDAITEDAAVLDRHSLYDQFSDWKLATFPPDVRMHFSLSITDEAAHAG